MSDKDLLDNIKTVFKRMSHAAMKAGRSPEEVTLVAVTKNVAGDVVRRAVEIGLRVFGENRVQEAKDKIALLKAGMPASPVTWHLIGHLQKNKARTAVELFDLIQSVDSVDLAEAINRHAAKEGKRQKILIQVKLSEEEAKHGVTKDNIDKLMDAVFNLENIETEGLMTIPPYFEDPEMSRPYFRQLCGIRDRYKGRGFDLPELSMGMSNDFAVAIEEGATMVRVGTAIFGERNAVKK